MNVINRMFSGFKSQWMILSYSIKIKPSRIYLVNLLISLREKPSKFVSSIQSSNETASNSKTMTKCLWNMK